MAVTVAKLVEFIRSNGKADEKPNARGNTVVRLFLPDERYTVDFADDFTAEGWQQFDTDEDAHYFGVWVNKSKQLTLTYSEGDWVLVVCPTAETYRAEIINACEFYGEGQIATIIHENGAKERLIQDRAAMFLS